MLERFTPRRVARPRAPRGLAAGADGVRAARTRSTTRSSRCATAQIEVGFVHKGLDDFMHKLDVLANRLVIALVVDRRPDRVEPDRDLRQDRAAHARPERRLGARLRRSRASSASGCSGASSAPAASRRLGVNASHFRPKGHLGRRPPPVPSVACRPRSPSRPRTRAWAPRGEPPATTAFEIAAAGERRPMSCVDDYGREFDHEELVERIRAVGGAAAQPARAGELTVDEAAPDRVARADPAQALAQGVRAARPARVRAGPGVHADGAAARDLGLAAAHAHPHRSTRMPRGSAASSALRSRRRPGSTTSGAWATG